MKQTIIRLFSLLQLGMVATGAQATYYKSAKIKLSANNTAAGRVYIKTTDPQNLESAHSGSVVVDAVIGTNGNEVDDTNTKITELYEAWLFAEPNPGYEFLGFVKGVSTDYISNVQANTDDIYADKGGVRVNVNVTSRNPSNAVGLDKPQSEHETERENYRNNFDWNINPDFEYTAIFDGPKNCVTLSYYKTIHNGYQSDSQGTFTSEIINNYANVKLTAIPASDLRLVGWYDANQNTKIGTDLEMIVDNVTSTYIPFFDLPPLTLNSELATYSYTRQTNFQTDGDRPAAYKVTAVGDKLTLVKVRHANPGEGVILQGEAGHTYEGMTYTGVFINPEDNHSDNLLKGTASGPVQANGKIYVLANKTKGLGFYKLAAGAEVPQGKAYLELDDASSARDFIGFDDGTTTSISSVTEVEQPTPIYNMAGQRVSSSFSGLVIQNGRKYIRK